jgi:CheY-specific phosphatase CheX
LLGIPFEAGESDARVGPSLTVEITYTGAFEGAVVQECSLALARRLVASMFQTEVDDVGDDELRDGSGEILNVIAGALSAQLPAGTRMSTPRVFAGTDHALAFPGTVPLESATYRVAAMPFHVTLLRRGPERGVSPRS